MAESKKDRNNISMILKDQCPPVHASDRVKQDLLKRLTSGEASKIAGKSTGTTAKAGQDIVVVVHLESEIVTGQISIPAKQRLSDYLNTPMKFIKLTGASISSFDSDIEKVSEIHINKEAIKILRTVDSDAARIPTGLRKKHKQTVQTIPVRTTMQIRDYELNGSLHCTDEIDVSQLLERGVVFLPCTEADIREISSNKLWHAGFVAVNRGQIYSLQKAG